MSWQGEAFRTARLWACLTLREMGELLGCSHTHLAHIEHGKKAPSDKLWARLAVAVPVPWDARGPSPVTYGEPCDE